MNIITHDPSDKENYAPCLSHSPAPGINSHTTYTCADKHKAPNKPLEPKPRKARHSRKKSTACPPKQQPNENTEPLTQPPSFPFPSSVLKSPTSPGRRGVSSKVANLAHSPPRASYADKVKGIFAGFDSSTREYITSIEQARKHTTVRHNKEHDSSSSSSALTSESELERRLNTIYDAAVTSSSDPPAEPNLASNPHPSVPSANPPKKPKLALRIPEPPAENDSSSDEWTGDEIFIPRATRRRARIDAARARPNMPNMSYGAPLSPQLISAATRGPIRELLERTSPVKTPKSSRFGRAAPALTFAAAHCKSLQFQF